MNYYLDTEFLEGTQKKRFLGIPYGETKPTIDLISIGIVAEDGREYYAISKDFNLKEAWSRYDGYKTYTNLPGDTGTNKRKNYWIRENVLHQIHYDLLQIEKPFNLSFEEWKEKTCKGFYEGCKNYKNLKRLLKKFGKTNKQIAEEIIEFTKCGCKKGIQQAYDHYNSDGICNNNPQFYAYYADYDWVAFCWLFGKMIDLPKVFPMYCIDLKQMLDETAELLTSYELSKLAHSDKVTHNVYSTYDTGALKCSKTDLLKKALGYPKQENEHNALADAKWNKELHEFLKTL